MIRRTRLRPVLVRSLGLGLALLLGPAAPVFAAGLDTGDGASSAADSAGPAATARVVGTSLVVSAPVPYRRARVRVVGPHGYEAWRVFEDGTPLVLDLLLDGWQTVVVPGKERSDRSAGESEDGPPRLASRRATPTELPDGSYRYEAILEDDGGAGGAQRTLAGGFSWRRGRAVDRRPAAEDGVGRASSPSPGSLSLAPKSATGDDAVLIRDLADDGRVWLQLRADDRDGNALEAWSLADVDGNLQVEERGNGSTLQRVALFVRQDSAGEVGVGTSAPATKLHVAGAKPAIRLDDTSGSFGTWDLQSFAGNVRWIDQSSGNAVLELHSGAPFESLYVDDNGFVGLGTNLPIAPLDVLSDTPLLALEETDEAGATLFLRAETEGGQRLLTLGGQESPSLLTLNEDTGTVEVHGDMRIGSSRKLKERIEPLSSESALEILADLEPVTFYYRTDPEDRHVGFIAEDVPDLVATPERATLSPMDMVAVVTRALQEQQAFVRRQALAIETLQARLDELERAETGRRPLPSGALPAACVFGPAAGVEPSP